MEAKRFFLYVTAIPCDDSRDAVLFKKTCPAFPFSRPSNKPFSNWLKENFPLLEWKLDDGEDNRDTDYCQYVADICEGGYMLASLQHIEDEQTFAILSSTIEN